MKAILKALGVFTFLLVAGVVQAQARIGVSIPLTGAQAPLGEGMSNAIKMAQDEWDSTRKVKFLIEDDAFVPRNAVSNVTSLLANDKINGLIVFGSSTSLAVADLVERNKVPMLSIATAEKVSTGRKFVMRHFLSPRIENELIVGEVQRRKYSSVAVVSTSQDGTLALRDYFINAKAVPVVYDKEFSPDERDFRTVAAEVKQRNPSAVYLLLLAPQGALFSRQLRSLRYEGDFFAAHQLEDAQEVKLADGALRSMWYVNSDVRAAADFHKRYLERFGVEAPNYAAGVYDIAKLMIEGSKTPNLNEYLHTVKGFRGALGRYDATSANDFALPHMLKLVTDEGFVKLR